MITNRRQYLYICTQIERFRIALEELDSVNVNPKATEAMRAAILSQLVDLEREQCEYEGLHVNSQ